MKTNSRRDSPRRRRLAVLAALAVLGCVLVIFVRATLGSAVSFILSPVVAGKVWLAESSSDLALSLRTEDALIGKIRALEEELAARETDALARRTLASENQALRSMLGLAVEERTVAPVLARPTATPYDTLLIGRGTYDGVQERAVVYADDLVVLGVVAAAYPESALVLLASAPGVTSDVYVRGADTFAVAEGRGGGVLRVALPQGIPLAAGDLVLLPAAGGVYGEVASVESVAESPYQYGYVTLPVALSALRTVLVDPEPVTELSYDAAQRVLEQLPRTLFPIADTPAATTTVEQSNE